jgi:hypothetical protein
MGNAPCPHAYMLLSMHVKCSFAVRTSVIVLSGQRETQCTDA